MKPMSNKPFELVTDDACERDTLYCLPPDVMAALSHYNAGLVSQEQLEKVIRKAAEEKRMALIKNVGR